MSTTFVQGQAGVWVQRNGPNTAPVYLGCHEVGDITIPYGDVTLFYCPDPAGSGNFIVRGSTQAAPGNITTTVVSDYTDEFDDLERARFPLTLFVTKQLRGRRDSFTNRDRAVMLMNARVTQRTIAGLSSRSPENNARSENNFDITAEAAFEDGAMTVVRQTITEAQAINNIRFCNTAQPRTSDSVARESCEVGFATTDAASTATANFLKTTDGATWTAASSDPFAADEHVVGLVCFETSRDVTRVIVGRGITDSGEAAEIAYSDNSGTSWTLVDLGGADDDFISTPNALFALDGTNVYAVTDLGYIFKSTDAGLTWTAQESGVITSGAGWRAIHFAERNVGWVGGETNFIARTIDGGATWSAIAGPSAKSAVSINAVFALDRNRAWLGYNDGTLYYTMNGGATWSQRSFTGTGSGVVKSIMFLNELQGYMIHNTSAPLGSLHKTIDGGYTWEKVTTPTNAGLNSLFICDGFKVYASGEASGGTGVILKGVI